MIEQFTLEGEALLLVREYALSTGLSLRESVICLLVMGGLVASQKEAKQAKEENREASAQRAEVRRMKRLEKHNASIVTLRQQAEAASCILPCMQELEPFVLPEYGPLQPLPDLGPLTLLPEYGPLTLRAEEPLRLREEEPLTLREDLKPLRY